MRWTLSVMLLSAVTLTAQVTINAQGPNPYSRKKEAALGAELAQQARQMLAPLDNSAALDYVQQLGAKLAAQLPEPPFTYTFALTASEQSDALHGNVLHEPLALPAGYIFVPASLFLAAQDEAEFTGMLAHAMARVADRDGTRAASRTEMMQMASTRLVFNRDNGPRQVAAPTSVLQYDRQYDREADMLAVKLTSAAGYDPQAMVRYFTRVWPDNAKDSNLRNARIAAMQKAIQQLASGTNASDEFRGIQEQIRAVSPK